MSEISMPPDAAGGSNPREAVGGSAAYRGDDRLRLALRSGDIGIWEWDIASGAVYWSEESGAIVGAPGVTTTSINVFESIVDDADAPQLTAAIQAAVRGAGRFKAEFRIRRLSDGAKRWLANEGEVVYDDSGTPITMIGVVRDITVRKELETVLRVSRDAALQRAAEVQSWLEDSPAVVWIAHDPECRLVTGSRAAEQLLAVPRGSNMSSSGENAPRMRHMSVWHEGRQLQPEEMPLQRAARGQPLSQVTLQLKLSDGRHVDLYGSAVPLFGADRQPCGAIATFVDVSAQRELERQLRIVADERAQLLGREQHAREIAETANQAKDQFLAMISHELRTPLNAIAGYIELLQKDAVSASNRPSVLEKIRRNVRLQSQLIDDLLEVSRAIHGSVALDAKPIVVTQPLTDAVDAVRLLAERKDIQITCNITAQDAVVVGDARRLQQVFSNVLTNAVKFTPQGGAIQVDLLERSDAIAVRVSDTGIGIAPEFLPRVFDAFTQAENRPAKQFGGLGLGLNIARALIAAHAGTITVTSPGLGLGATCHITLPRAG